MDYLDIYVFFIIYSFLGWVCESIYCSAGEHRLINRGFLTGPFCPIYGLGALLILMLLSPLTDNFTTIFFAGIVITSVLEYVSSYILEVAFNTKWWDYSNYKFNIQGRVCLKNSLLFGILCVLLHFFIHPYVEMQVSRISMGTLQVIAVSFTAFFAVDFSHAVYTILKLNSKLTSLEKIRMELAVKSAELSQDLGIENVIAKIRRLRTLRSTFPEFESVEEVYRAFYRKLANIRYSERRLLRAFPKMRNLSTPYIQAMREYIADTKEYINDKLENNDKSGSGKTGGNA